MRYIKVTSDILAMGMKPLETLIYALVRPYCVGLCRGYETKIGELADLLNVERDQARYALRVMRKKGLIKTSRQQYSIIIKIVDIYPSEQPQMGNNTPSETQIGDIYPSEQPQMGNLTVSDGVLLPITPYSSNNNNGPLKNINTREIILCGIVDFYEQGGMTYIPDFVSETTATAELAAKIELMMQKDGWVMDADSVRTYWTDFLRNAWEVADKWQREHFDIKIINSQFNNLINKIKIKSNGNGNTTSRDARGADADELVAALRAHFDA